eukprot:CAMPEP_0184704908 /NCGR_PEP_ID=MMETSP0313-20130426/32681_1 /TAXON_ID=2792 /ORGANISM="Porphyridium aerugineum, Strain SAG 1380-2" /LENGTH=101 /DNA_ID=CAMNT_0027166109 /DNA_START=175 /DNA_END=480 /DNA_ORIENTATION=+
MANNIPSVFWMSSGRPKNKKSVTRMKHVLLCPRILYVNAELFPMTRKMEMFTRKATRPVNKIAATFSCVKWKYQMLPVEYIFQSSNMGTNGMMNSADKMDE